MDSLITQSLKVFVSSLNPTIKDLVLRELIKEKSRSDKKALYRELGESVYRGVRLSGKYTYAIFAICNIDQFITNDNYIYSVYAHLDGSWKGDHYQIMFIDDGEQHVKFNCARVRCEKDLSPLISMEEESDIDALNDYSTMDHQKLFQREFIEHPEARRVYEILNAKKLKGGYSVAEASIVVRLRADILIGDDDLHSFRPTDHGDKSDVDLFSHAIQSSAHCDEFDPKEYREELEFTIVVNDRKCQAILRQFECPGADGG